MPKVSWTVPVAASEDGVVHESVANTDHDNDAVLKQGYSAASAYDSASLAALYMMHEDSGTTVYDFSGNNNDGSNTNAEVNVSFLLGTTGYRFGVSSDHLSGLNPSISGSVAVTMILNLSKTGSTQYLYNNYDGSAPYFITQIDANDNPVMTVNDGTFDSFAHSATLTTGTIYLITFVYDNSDGGMYIGVNGTWENVGTHGGSAPNYNDSGLVFGYDKNQSANYFGGDAAYIRVDNAVKGSTFHQYLVDVFNTPGSLITTERSP